MEEWEPRTDIEMLKQLLKLNEGEHLDFKEWLDLEEPQHKLNLVKDIVAMMNSYPGGHLIIGVRNDGSFADNSKKLQPDDFDGAKLKNLVAKYVDASLNIASAIHIIDGHELVIIAVQSGVDGLPVPFTRQGEFSDDGKMKHVFHIGDIWLRESSENVKLKSAHWQRLLEPHDKRIRDEVQQTVNAIFSQLAQYLQSRSGDSPTLPLTLQLPDEALARVTGIYLSEGKFVRVMTVLKQAINSISNEDDSGLVKAGVIFAQALLYDNEEVLAAGLDALYDLFIKKTTDNSRRLDIAVMLYALGSLAVRYSRWKILTPMALKPFPQDTSQYFYPSWIRAAQVSASRSNKLPSDEHGLMISRAHGLMANYPELRPDIQGNLPDISNTEADAALDSLCQFDFILLLLQQALVKNMFDDGGYPLSAWFSEDRIMPLVEKLVVNSSFRRILFPDINGDEFLQILYNALETAERQAVILENRWNAYTNALDFVRSQAKLNRDNTEQ